MSALTESGPPERGPISLAEAAESLGCHIETLRERVREGDLRATRGPHGRYYVTEAALNRMRPLKSRAARALTPVELESSWAWLESVLSSQLRFRQREQEIVSELRADPSRKPALYRLLSVQRLLAAGLGCEAVARELGITARHVRRLRYRDAQQALRAARGQRGLRNVKEAERRSRQIISDLRRRLEASGFRGHRQTYNVYARETRLPAFRVKRLPVDWMSRLRTMGLSEEEVKAIATIGMGEDELNQLLLYGLPNDS